MTPDRAGSHWLDQYASTGYRWRQAHHDGKTSFYRPLGLVEFCFDADGRYYEGRADMNVQLDVNFQSKLNKQQLREHLTLAWACLRSRHTLTQAKSLPRQQWMAGDVEGHQGIYFVVDLPADTGEALLGARSQLVFLEDDFPFVDPLQFWSHAQNTARIVDPEAALAKLFVLPVDKLQGETQRLTFLLITSHQIQDGIAMYNWMSDFIWLLNKTTFSLRSELDAAIRPEQMTTRLPLPQEALYPPVSGSRARQRWVWLLTRILRHVRKPLPAGFPNPLQRREPLCSSVSPSPMYAPVLDYSRTPPNNSAPCRTRATRKSTARLVRLCRQARVSVGAGCFALAALLMMEFHERREPNVRPCDRKPFITGFPINPRPFLARNPPADSLMLAFCDGITLPFLPSSLDLDGRLRLLARQAHRQLAAYQKRIRPDADPAGLQYMSSRGAGRVLATQYLSSLERCEALVPPALRKGVDPQGAYPMRPNATRQTCGVSSVGRGALVVECENAGTMDGERDLIAEPEGLNAGVRAREGEFLIGIGGGDEGLWANVSVDLATMDPKLVVEWQRRFECFLEDDGEKPRL